MAMLDKQIQASEKRIAKHQKNVLMYTQRIEKKIKELQKKNIPVTENDFKVVKTGRWKYDYEVENTMKGKENYSHWTFYPVIGDLVSRQENIDKLNDEKIALQKLIEAKNEKENTKTEIDEVNKSLGTQFSVLLEPFKEEWIKQMIGWHTRFYNNIHSKLAESRKMYQFLSEKLPEMYRESHWKKTSLIEEYENAKKYHGRVISSEPAKYDTVVAYLNNIKPKLHEEWANAINTLADKCRKFNLDVPNVTIHHPRLAERGFDVIIKDNKDRLLDARMIWAAEYSDCVTPHTRYIITERTIKKENKSMEKNYLHHLIDWGAFKEELLKSLSNERIWSKGNTGDYNPHEENIKYIEELLEMINKGEFEEIVAMKKNEMGEDAQEYFSDYMLKANISDIRIRKTTNNDWYISCKLNGEKQLSKRMGKDDVAYYQERMQRSDKAYNAVAPELAKKYYAKEIGETANQQQNETKRLKR